MTTNKFVIFSLIFEFNAIFLLASSVPAPNKSLNEGKEDLLSEIDNDLETYINNNIKLMELMEIKDKLELSCEETLLKTRTFLKEIEEEEDFYMKDRTDYRYQCRDFGLNCNYEPEYERCSDNLINKSDYTKSIDIFLKLLFNDFNKTVQKFEQQLQTIKIEIDTIKMLGHVYYLEHKLNGGKLIDSTMGIWKNETITKLHNDYMKLLAVTKELISSFKKLSSKERKFEEAILEEINAQKLLYACCLRKLDFVIEGLDCLGTSGVPSNNQTLFLGR